MEQVHVQLWYKNDFFLNVPVTVETVLAAEAHLSQ